LTLGTLQTSRETSQDAAKQQLMPLGIDIPVGFDSREHTAFFRQSTRSKAFSQGWDTEGYHNQYIDRGKLYHRLFSAISTPEDVEPAINDLIHEGLLDSEQAEESLAYVQKALSQPQATDWFSGRHRLFNECSILTHDATGHTLMKRPDRVMQDGDTLTVVDFKFGKPAASHHRQVQEYMQLLAAMGYPAIEGFLWYVDEEQVVPV
jgi:ATP-dependent helicase/nuclease subunit A